MPERRYSESDGLWEVGSHTGHAAALNIRNPQPGWHYYHVKRDRASIQRFMNMGYKPLRSDDPEMRGAIEFNAENVPELDGLQAYKDVVAMKIPEDLYRTLLEEKARKAAIQREGTADAHVSKGQNLAARAGANRDDLYYASKHHGES